ncbi:four-helix bundle copper-binding protein [Streptomyces sp. NPDC085946]|uniref:four-helix bundle copper-binding protein n=1 Tax=Streptomyces sp. NPDC085946 TaxID=3365744 RepID=UPI0037D7919E
MPGTDGDRCGTRPGRCPRESAVRHARAVLPRTRADGWNPSATDTSCRRPRPAPAQTYCADICNATAAALSRHTGYGASVTRAILQACATVCKVCGGECASRADRRGHCRVCAEACRRCEQACNDLITSLG